MRLPVLAILFSMAAAGVQPGEFRDRRERLRKAVPDAIFVLFGASEEHSGLRQSFFQEPSFYYLTGWRQPGALAVITPDAEVLFLPSRDPNAEKYTGRKAAADDPGVADLAGFASVEPRKKLEVLLPQLAASAAKLYVLESDPRAQKIKQLLPLRPALDAAAPIGDLRMIKSPAEVDLIQKAVDATVRAHRAGWTRTSAGAYEYQVANAIALSYLDAGCERHAYAPIVGSGPNATVLHYSDNRRRMDSGELVLMDVGAECAGYAADVTRTVPVDGKFTARQRELYDIVLGAQKAAIAAVKPGMTLGGTTQASLHKIAMEYLNAHGKDKHGQPLGKYFNHGLGHGVGLDVHDPLGVSAALKPGMVITVEPGLYIPEEGIGIRIEDVVLVTENGHQVLSSALPREARQIEEALERRVPHATRD
jgi:Xaa-Pro aminopeptidase